MKRWEEALQLAVVLSRLIPGHISPYLDMAFCLHEMKRTAEAKQCLLHGPEALKRNSTYYYNMACYDAQLGNLAGARAFLNQAVSMDGHYREMARHDPDLEPLRASGDLSLP